MSQTHYCCLNNSLVGLLIEKAAETDLQLFLYEKPEIASEFSLFYKLDNGRLTWTLLENMSPDITTCFGSKSTKLLHTGAIK